MSLFRYLAHDAARRLLVRIAIVALLSSGCGREPELQNKESAAEAAASSREATGRKPTLPEGAPSGVPLPDGLLPITGEELIEKVRQSPAKAVLINAWASWCGACKAEMPMLLEVEKRYAKAGIEIWFVSVDQPSAVLEALQFLKDQGVKLPSYIANGRLGPFKQALSPQWQGTLPATFLYDGSGKLRYFWGAQVFEEELTPVLDGFLAGKKIDGAANFKVRVGEGR